MNLFCFVPTTGFEPAHPNRIPPPQSGVSTIFTTWAFYSNYSKKRSIFNLSHSLALGFVFKYRIY